MATTVVFSCKSKIDFNQDEIIIDALIFADDVTCSTISRRANCSVPMNRYYYSLASNLCREFNSPACQAEGNYETKQECEKRCRIQPIFLTKSTR